MEVITGIITLQMIFSKYWEAFKKWHNGKIREAVLFNVKKIVKCRTGQLGFHVCIWVNLAMSFVYIYTIFMEKKKCSRCGKEVDSYSYLSYCYSCAVDVWDTGFESTSQHADEQYEQEQKRIEKLNRKLNKARINYKEVYNTLQYEYGRLRCAQCGYVRIRSNVFYNLRKKGKLLDALKRPCPKCNVKGFYIFE